MDGWLAGWLAGCPYGWLCACVIMAAPWNSLSGIAGRSPGLDVGVRVSLFVDMYGRGYHVCDLAGGLL